MKTGVILILATALGVQAASADEATNSMAPFKDLRERASYAVGVSIGSNIKRSHFDLDYDVMLEAIKTTANGGTVKLTDEQVRETLMAYQQELQHQLLQKNHEEGEKFLAENKKKPGVKVLPVTLPDGKTAELQYKVLEEGTGEMPKSTDTVSVNYRGTFINGTEFDSSAKHGGRPAQFPVTGVIKGWTEALERMKTGAKWQLFIPSSLAYGDNGRPGIEPASTLIFDVELLSIEAPKPAASAGQPGLTSDIVRVPSSEEMKAGAKPQIIKSQDLEKMLKTNSPAPK